VYIVFNNVLVFTKLFYFVGLEGMFTGKIIFLMGMILHL